MQALTRNARLCYEVLANQYLMRRLESRLCIAVFDCSPRSWDMHFTEYRV